MYFVAFVGFALVANVYGDCAQELVQTQEYMDCMTSYGTYMSSLDTNVAPEDMVQYLCTEEARTAMECLYGFISKCPALGENQPNLQSQEEYNAICSGGPMPGGGGVMPGVECMESMKCVGTSASGFDMDGPASAPKSKYTVAIFTVKYLCGPFEEMLTCLKDAPESCRENIEEMIQNSTTSMTDALSMMGLKGLSYSKLKMYTEQNCATVPEQFTTNECASIATESKEFNECYNTALANETANTISCTAYATVSECIDTALESCGDGFTDTVKALGEAFVPRTPTDCVTASASFIQASFLTLIIAFFLSSKF